MAPDPAKYTFDAEERHFLDKFGRRVDRKKVRESLDTYIDSVTADIRADTQAMVDGNLSIGAWHLKMEGHIKRSHTAAAAIAKGGWKQAKGSDWALAGREIKEQYQYLYRFARQLEAGRPVNGQTVARAEMYGLSATKTYEGILRRDDLVEGFDLERRILHSVIPCLNCSYYTDLGWVVAGTLPMIGEQCQCLTRCRCSFERKRSQESQKRRKASRPKMPKPPAQKKPPVEKPPPVVIPTATPKPKPPVVTPKPRVAKPVPLPKPKPEAPPPAPQEPTQPVPDDPVSRIEAARESQREANRKWASGNKSTNRDYSRLNMKFPDLIPPGPVQERLGRYTVGDEKVKAIQDIGRKYEGLTSGLEKERDQHNRDLMDLVKKQQKLIEKYVGSSKPIPKDVSSQVDAIQKDIDKKYKIRDEVREKMTNLERERRDEAHSFLKVKDPATFHADPLDLNDSRNEGYKEATGAVKETIDRAVSWLKTHVARGNQSTAEVEFGVSETRRAFAFNRKKTFVSVYEGVSDDTVVHEIGHAMDYKFTTGEYTMQSGEDNLGKRSREFLEYRVGNETPVSMNEKFGGYKEDEFGRKDKFGEHFEERKAYYVGHTRSVETFTMGLQEMFNDPVRFSTNAPEYAKWVMGILDGSLR